MLPYYYLCDGYYSLDSILILIRGLRSINVPFSLPSDTPFLYASTNLASPSTLARFFRYASLYSDSYTFSFPACLASSK